MASSSSSVAFSLVLSVSLLLPRALGVICEELSQDLCAFAISSASQRCVLESTPRTDGGPTEYECYTSGVVVTHMSDWIETEHCVRVCGLDRNTVGISSDALLDRHFIRKLCSGACHHNCPNVVDLHSNLAAGEGESIILAELCSAHHGSPRREMVELLSSGSAPGFMASPPAQ
ncbi:uncharacterized protein LOC109719239 isoform X2 [Ananas comosus]|uniref:Uncharacterized protein LOC109719239 isoform X2 n=1 Tax=Ananas comosus TaxID=4615 RepID=A0A6P5G7Z6_ANACO|nr:uncharacterized protein LOC109719239 isoform X2 [Ananas comosus]